MKKSKNFKLKWWYFGGYDYRKLLTTDRIRLVGELEDGTIISDEVSLVNKNGTAFAVIPDQGEVMLHPSYWILPTRDNIESYWFTDEKNSRTSKTIKALNSAIKRGKAWNNKTIIVHGRSTGKNLSNYTTRVVNQIVPLDKEHILAKGDGFQTVLAKPEQDESKIAVAMNRIAV